MSFCDTTYSSRDFTNLHLVILIFIVCLPINAGKEVDAVGANQVDRAFALQEMKIKSLIFEQKTLMRVSLALLGTSMST